MRPLSHNNSSQQQQQQQQQVQTVHSMPPSHLATMAQPEQETAGIVHVPTTMIMSRANGNSTSSLDARSSSGSSHGSKDRTRVSPIPVDNDDVSPPVTGTSLAFSPSADEHKGLRRPPETVQQASGGPVEDTVVGILASGLAWVQRNRERRRRHYLQHQAELQLRKIAEAELHSEATSVTNHHGSTSTPDNHYQNHNHHLSQDDNDTHPTENADFIIGTHLSKSGEGATGELDLAMAMGEEYDEEYLIPKVRIETEPNKRSENGEEGTSSSFEAPTYLLTPDQMHQIAIRVLPRTIAYCPWRRLYGLARDGDSFDACLRLLADVPRTLMVIRTTRGHVFGGYADSPWKSSELGNNRFYGSAQACLFSVNDPDNQQGLEPKQMLNVYKWSGKNRYIQLCDVSHKMIAFGGGGLDGAFGLCVQDDFQSGSTGPCDTFDNEPLCPEETFEIVDLEVWEFLTGVF